MAENVADTWEELEDSVSIEVTFIAKLGPTNSTAYVAREIMSILREAVGLNTANHHRSLQISLQVTVNHSTSPDINPQVAKRQCVELPLYSKLRKEISGSWCGVSSILAFSYVTGVPIYRHFGHLYVLM